MTTTLGQLRAMKVEKEKERVYLTECYLATVIRAINFNDQLDKFPEEKEIKLGETFHREEVAIYLEETFTRLEFSFRDIVGRNKLEIFLILNDDLEINMEDGTLVA